MENTEQNRGPLAGLSDELAGVVERIGPSVVRVNGRRPSSGVVYAPGMVLTVGHALGHEDDLSVVTHDGRTLEAHVAGHDPSAHLTVLRADGLTETAAPAEGMPRPGQLALAVGRSSRDDGVRTTLGVVSGVVGPLRVWRGVRMERAILTDATPYRGLSGGPLVDASGNVLGILTAGWSRGGTTLAIPADIAWLAAGTLESGGSVKRGYLGILSQPVEIPGTGRSGLLVAGVEEGSPAGRGGVLIGDVLTTLDDQAVHDTDDLLSLMSGERVGQTVAVVVIRGGEEKTLQVTVGERG